MKTIATVVAALTLSGCATDSALPASSNASFDPIAFFGGRSHGEGTLDTLLEGPVRISVDSVGRVDGGTVILDQIIRRGANPPRARRWTLRPVAPNRLSGTLTDATGPVLVTTSGPRAFISYTMKGGFEVEQQLALQSDGRTVLNRLEVKKFGMRVATLDETIRKLD